MTQKRHHIMLIAMLVELLLILYLGGWYGNTKMISGGMLLSTAAVLVERGTLIVTVLNYTQ